MKHHSTKFDYCNNAYISLYAFINTNSIYAFNYPIISRINVNNIDDAIFWRCVFIEKRNFIDI